MAISLTPPAYSLDQGLIDNLSGIEYGISRFDGLAGVSG
jgi:hypothetical protein